MIHLFLSIFSSTLIFVAFKIAQRYTTNLSLLITINYLMASLLGFLLFSNSQVKISQLSLSFFAFAAVLGGLFIVMFFLIGKSTQNAGLTVTTLANKLSLVFPVLFSLLYFNENLTNIKIVGIALAFVAVVLTVFKKEISKTQVLYIVLPVLIFFGSGLVDSLVKYIQEVKITGSLTPVFTTFVFLTAFICGALVFLFQQKTVKIKKLPTLTIGVLLGAANFGSLYFIINALNHSDIESSRVFAINNMSIVTLTALIGKIVFREKLSYLNYAGIILSVISIYFLL